MPSASSYRSARMNQNANPPVLWIGDEHFFAALTPSDPLSTGVPPSTIEHDHADHNTYGLAQPLALLGVYLC